VVGELPESWRVGEHFWGSVQEEEKEKKRTVVRRLVD